MHLAKLYVAIVLILAVLCFETDEQKACSCYTFEGGATGKKSWPVAKRSCENQNKHLVAMETEREWEFIKNETQSRTNSENNEWLIGLFRNSTKANWTWVSGQPLTIHKWQVYEPNFGDLYSLIAKNFPKNSYGLFGGISKDVRKEWICEEETDNCIGTCMYHNLVPTTATSTTRTTTATTERTSSATQDHTNVTSESTSSGDETTPAEKLTGDKSNPTTVIVAVSLAAVLFIALIVLAVVFYLKRNKRRPPDAERSKKKSPDQPDNAYEAIDRAEVANLLETPDSNSVPHGNEQAEYAMVNKKEKRKQNIEETPQVPHTTDCEYAVVNKENRKKKEGDLVYAQLDMGEFDDTENDTKEHKPAPYEPTVYADVTPNVIKGSDPESTQPTYENIQTTGV